MQVVALRRRHSDGCGFRSHLSRLIHTTGKDEFQTALALAGREALGCEHVTAFAFGPGLPPRVLNVSGTFNELAVHRAAVRYSHNHWRLDPTNIFRSRPLDEGYHYVALVSEHEVTDSQYRQDCYTMTGISHRMSVLERRQGEYIKLSFHRTRRAGPFQVTDLSDLLDHVDLIMDLVSRHALSWRAGGSSADASGHYLRALKTLDVGLTPRESQVCAGIVAGQNSAQIGASLGVSINTVRTLRRRAYARLSISSQNELLRRILR
jgi:DNA-binding CsgD family transcriptional regulator